jgi:excinuclease UvrABC nuclease subunit
VADRLDAVFENVAELPPPHAPLEATDLPRGGGVYALADEGNRVLLTLGTQSLRRSLMHRLRPPPREGPTRRVDLRAIARTLHWTPTHSVFETYLVYLNAARRLRPQRYRKDLAFGPVWFARVDPGQPFPRWEADPIAFRGGVDIGPFADRGSCAAFIELLEDIFDLCRKHDILVQAPHGQACVYHEMGRCPAPCDGSVSVEAYHEQVRRSIDFAIGGHARYLREMEERMRTAAASRAFEQAGRIKTLWERAGRRLEKDGRLAVTPDRFRYLVVQRGGGTTRVRPFFVHAGAIERGDSIPRRKIDEQVASWVQRLAALPAEPGGDPVERSEGLWLVSHFLGRADKAPGLFLPAAACGDPEDVARRVKERLGRRERASENMRDPAARAEDVES